MNRRTFLKLPMIPIAAMLPVIPIAKTKFNWNHNPKKVLEGYAFVNDENERFVPDAILYIGANGERIPIKCTITKETNSGS